jgi:hypothetical protein
MTVGAKIDVLTAAPVWVELSVEIMLVLFARYHCTGSLTSMSVGCLNVDMDIFE